MSEFIPENLVPLIVGAPRLGTTAISLYFDVRGFEKVWLIGQARVAAAAAITWTPMKDYAAMGAGTPAVLGYNAPNWAALGAVNTHIHLARQADAANYATAATAGDHICVFEIDPLRLGDSVANGPYLYVTMLCTALVADYVAVLGLGLPRYAYTPNFLPDYTV